MSKALEMHDLVFGSFDQMINNITFDSLNRQALIGEVRGRLGQYLPNLPPFDKLVEVVKESIETVQAIGETDLDSLPDGLRQLVTVTRDTLTASRASHTAMVESIVSKYLDESDMDTITTFFKSDANIKLRNGGLLDATLTPEDIDTVAAFLKSDAGAKFRTMRVAMQNELNEATSQWRNDSLEPRREEIGKVLGFEEPAPAETTPADAPTEPTAV